jgi:hypothetical protein
MKRFGLFWVVLCIHVVSFLFIVSSFSKLTRKGFGFMVFFNESTLGSSFGELGGISLVLLLEELRNINYVLLFNESNSINFVIG